MKKYSDKEIFFETSPLAFSAPFFFLFFPLSLSLSLSRALALSVSFSVMIRYKQIGQSIYNRIKLSITFFRLSFWYSSQRDMP